MVFLEGRRSGEHSDLPNRILVFPGTGQGSFVAESAIDDELRPLDHVTIDRRETGTSRSHLSPPRDEDWQKERMASRYTMELENAQSVHLGTLAVADRSALDSGGIAWMPAGPGITENPEVTDEALRDCVGGDHLVCSLPERATWSKESHLQVNLLVAREHPPDQLSDLPTVTRSDIFQDETPPERHVNRASAVEMKGWYLVATTAVLPGRPGLIERRDEGYTWRAFWAVPGD